MRFRTPFIRILFPSSRLSFHERHLRRHFPLHHGLDITNLLLVMPPGSPREHLYAPFGLTRIASAITPAPAFGFAVVLECHQSVAIALRFLRFLCVIMAF